jgi:hypothetical protein
VKDGDRELFFETLDSVSIIWMAGTELGQTAHEETEVLLWPYQHETVSDLAMTFVHEVAHLMYPDLAEGAINAKTAALWKREWCRREAYKWVAAGLLDAVKLLKHKSKGKVLIG